jgi:DUF971 family protein
MTLARESPPGGAAWVPSAIRVRSVSRLLEVDWRDGTTSAWSHGVLRRHCRCAPCEARCRAGIAIDVAADVVVMQIEACGPGALRFVFSDGHDRGIYPYAYLRQLPECIDCTVAR